MALVQFWQLADNAASTTVVATTGTDGTLTGGDNTSVLHAAGPSATIPSSLDLDGAADYVDVTLSAFVRTNSQAMSLSMWFKADGTGAMIFLGITAGASPRLRKLNTSVRISTTGTGAVTDTTWTVPTLGIASWHHVLFTRDGSNNGRVFLDGIESSSGAQTAGGTFAPLAIGRDSTTFWDGKLAWVKLYDSDESANAGALFLEGMVPAKLAAQGVG